MLVLSRKKNERVRIGDEVTLTVVDIRGDKVRIGFDAPDDVRIDREEVWQDMRASGGNYSYAHLWDGERYLGPTKCSTRRHASRAVQRHTEAHARHWGMVTASEEPPALDAQQIQG